MAVNENRKALVEEHLPLIGYHVNEMMARVPRHVARDDLASAGALALVRAAEGYDPATGVPFNRYAAIRIRGALVARWTGPPVAHVPRSAASRQ